MTDSVSSETPETPSRMLRILIVDDEPRVRETLALVLRRAGHEVACAPSGRAALDHIDAGPAFDVVLTDLGMPDVNGWSVARSAKERWPQVPVGLVTGWGDDASLGTAADRATVDFILAKPVDRRTLTDTIARVTQLAA